MGGIHMSSTDWLSELAAAEREATGGEWTVDPNDGDHGTPLILGANDKPVLAFHQADHDSEAWWLVSDEDARLIVALRNAAPRLLAVARRSVALERALLAIANQYDAFSDAGRIARDALDAVYSGEGGGGHG